MTEQQKRGRTFILAIIVGGILEEISTFTVSISIVRIILSAIIWYFLYQGHRWAKNLLIVLMGISGIIGAYSVIGFILLSKDVNAFLDRKRSGI